MSTTSAGGTLTLLKTSAGAVGVLCAVQLVLGMLTLGQESSYKEVHGLVGMVTALAAVVAAIAAALWRRRSGNTGLMGHAIGTAVLAIVQVALGEAELKTVHIVLGLVVVVSGIALATLSLRKSGTAR